MDILVVVLFLHPGAPWVLFLLLLCCSPFRRRISRFHFLSINPLRSDLQASLQCSHYLYHPSPVLLYHSPHPPSLRSSCITTQPPLLTGNTTFAANMDYSRFVSPSFKTQPFPPDIFEARAAIMPVAVCSPVSVASGECYTYLLYISGTPAMRCWRSLFSKSDVSKSNQLIPSEVSRAKNITPLLRDHFEIICGEFLPLTDHELLFKSEECSGGTGGSSFQLRNPSLSLAL